MSRRQLNLCGVLVWTLFWTGIATAVWSIHTFTVAALVSPWIIVGCWLTAGEFMRRLRSDKEHPGRHGVVLSAASDDFWEPLEVPTYDRYRGGEQQQTPEVLGFSPPASAHPALTPEQILLIEEAADEYQFSYAEFRDMEALVESMEREGFTIKPKKQ